MSRKQAKKVSETVAQKIVEETLNSLGRDPDPAAASLSEYGFAEQLYAKAPSAFLAALGASSLVKIAKEGFTALKAFLAAREPIVVQKRIDGDSVGVFALKDDCPFIISSMIECARAEHLSIDVILHPVLSCGQRRVAFSYLVLNQKPLEVTEAFYDSLKEVLEDVRIATDSFQEMQAFCQGLCSRLLQGELSVLKGKDASEIASFVEWLEKGSYLLLGTASFSVGDKDEIAPVPETSAGIFGSSAGYCGELIEEVKEDAQSILRLKEAVWISRLRVRSLVQRRSRMHNVTLCVSENGKTKIVSLVGLFTYAAHAGTSSAFPLIRRKFQEIVQMEKAVPNTHDYKHILETIDRMPLDEALSLDIKTLQRIVRMTQGIHNTSETRVLVVTNPLRRVLTLLVVMSRDRYTAEVSESLRNYLERLGGNSGGLTEYHIDTSLNPFARVYFQVPIPREGSLPCDEEKIEHDVVSLSYSWKEHLAAELDRLSQRLDSEALKGKYLDAFSPAYQALHTPNECIRDILELEQLNEAAPIRVALYRGAAPVDLLVIYRIGEELVLSKVLPFVEAAGLEVLHAEGLEISLRSLAGKCFIYRLKVRKDLQHELSDDVIHNCFCPGLVSVLVGQHESDVLNSLMLSAGLGIRQIALIRTYCAHLLQLRRYSSNTRVFGAIAELPEAARVFWECFEIRFDPDYRGDRAAESARKVDRYKELLREVGDLTQDRILKGLLSLLEHTLRTNYFHYAGAIALKIESRSCEIMPLPRPHVEIYVRAASFEGVHLRGGPVSRGGLRWSDRFGDFRNEILGLMKTQRIKNVIIAPDGAKGGFVVRNLPESGDEIKHRVIDAYQNYIRALLSITDNRIGGKVVKPARVVSYDGDDPYLVVAADKGTASFSDTANRIAVEEYNFWLGDAFASGGSKGYSHKDLGITAKGAWECVKRLFRDLGVDEESQTFSAIGIGDMAGDVFGNGMLLSSNVKLLGAFNHKHIFLDPNPDPKVSFSERKRLFQLPVSQWSDYDHKVISKGGGVFSRFEKEIKLNKEVRHALGITEEVPDVVDAETLVSLMLKSPVDLLWNGGIGTYVKSSLESHSDVNDGANDNVRINASELRCKVVGEGGNLGLTQRARVEFSLRGGKINTDAVDNSGGVDLSDHEVNLKIMFAEAVAAGKLSMEDRDRRMREVSDEVMEAVLANNRSQARSLSLGELRSAAQIDFYSPLIAFLHRNGYLHRDLEALPDEEDLKERARQKLGLARPELAVVMAGAKMWMKNLVIDSNLVSDRSLEDDLLLYFPQSLRESFKKEILGHPLAKNILALQVVNYVVDLFGMSFVFRFADASSSRPIEVLKCCVTAERLLKGREIGSELARLDTVEHNQLFMSARQELGRALRRTAAWYLKYHKEGSVADLVWVFSSSHADLVSALKEVLDDGERRLAEDLFAKYTGAGLPETVAIQLSFLPWVRETLQMLWVSRLAGCSVREAAVVFRKLLRSIGVQRVFNARDNFQFKDKWEYELYNLSTDEIWRALTVFSARLIQMCDADEAKLNAEIAGLVNLEDILAISRSAMDNRLSVAGAAVLAKKLNEACAKYQIGA